MGLDIFLTFSEGLGVFEAHFLIKIFLIKTKRVIDLLESKVFIMKMNCEKEYSIGKNRMLNPLLLLCVPENIWLLQKPC